VFGSIGLPELMIIFVLALLLFGPRKLPEIGRGIGRALGEFRRASNDLKRTIEEEVATEDLRQVARDARAATAIPSLDELAAAAAAPASPAASAEEQPAPPQPDAKPLEPR
jgi:TatA/E family protein of Tat protein translocase